MARRTTSYVDSEAVRLGLSGNLSKARATVDGKEFLKRFLWCAEKTFPISQAAEDQLEMKPNMKQLPMLVIRSRWHLIPVILLGSWVTGSVVFGADPTDTF